MHGKTIAVRAGGVVFGGLTYVLLSVLTLLIRGGPGVMFFILGISSVVVGVRARKIDGLLTAFAVGTTLAFVISWLVVFWDMFGIASLALMAFPALLNFVVAWFPGFIAAHLAAGPDAPEDPDPSR